MKLASLLLVCAIAVTACGRLRTAREYELPSGFSGWALIEFEVPDAPPLPKKDGKYVLRLGKDGRLKTSSREEEGWTRDSYFFVGTGRTPIPATTPGGGGLIWSQAMGGVKAPGQKERVYEIFFVGSEQSLRESKQKPPTPE